MQIELVEAVGNQPERHCCIWRSLPSTSSTRALNALIDAQIDRFEHFLQPSDGKRLHFAIPRRRLRPRCNSAHRQHTLGLGLQELPPSQRRPRRRWSNATALQDRPHGAGSDPVAQSAQLAVDAAITPSRVLPGQPQHQLAELGRQSRTATLTGIGQRRRTRSRCQRSSVAGCTSSPRQTGRGSSRASPASTARSAQSTRGRAAWRRSTATSWRIMSSSASLAAALRDSSASHRSTWRTADRAVEGSCADLVARCLPGELAAQHPRPTFWHPHAHDRPRLRIRSNGLAQAAQSHWDVMTVGPTSPTRSTSSEPHHGQLTRSEAWALWGTRR